MLPISAALQASFEAYVQTGQIPKTVRSYYKKWLRYYLDFCHKYGFPHAQRESLSPFLQKLQEKKQSEWQQQQTTHAVSLCITSFFRPGGIMTFPLPAPAHSRCESRGWPGRSENLSHRGRGISGGG